MSRADADPDVAEAVELVVLCDRFHALPRAGGLLDQDAWDVQRMMWVADAMETRAELDRQKAKRGK